MIARLFVQAVLNYTNSIQHDKQVAYCLEKKIDASNQPTEQLSTYNIDRSTDSMTRPLDLCHVL